jgi:hypothetical protein
MRRSLVKAETSKIMLPVTVEFDSNKKAVDAVGKWLDTNKDAAKVTMHELVYSHEPCSESVQSL